MASHAINGFVTLFFVLGSSFCMVVSIVIAIPETTNGVVSNKIFVYTSMPKMELVVY